MTKAALNSDGTKAAIVGGNINATVCGNSDLPITQLLGHLLLLHKLVGRNCRVTWGLTLLCLLVCILARHSAFTANYQNEDLTIETNPLSSDPSNGIVIKQTSATSFDVTINDGKFITKE